MEYSLEVRNGLQSPPREESLDMEDALKKLGWLLIGLLNFKDFKSTLCPTFENKHVYPFRRIFLISVTRSSFTATD